MGKGTRSIGNAGLKKFPKLPRIQARGEVAQGPLALGSDARELQFFLKADSFPKPRDVRRAGSHLANQRLDVVRETQGADSIFLARSVESREGRAKNGGFLFSKFAGLAPQAQAQGFLKRGG